MPQAVATVNDTQVMLQTLLKHEPDRVHALSYLTNIAHFNFYRLLYPIFTFHDKQRIHTKYLEWFPEKEDLFDVAFFTECIQTIQPRYVVELGGGIGALARHILPQCPMMEWHSYDLIAHKVPVRLNFVEHVLSCELWESKASLKGADVFIASHTLEHFCDEELTKLFAFIKRWKIPQLLFQSPVKPHGQTWQNFYGAHVLQMGSRKIKQLLQPEYELQAEVPKGKDVYDGWCSHFARKP